jgi:hypothetical protein
MWNKFKSLPLSVQISVAFLLCVLVFAVVMFPLSVIVFGTIAALLRVFFYFTEEMP